jgi:DNA-binding beta-propeller fold protein YncE
VSDVGALEPGVPPQGNVIIFDAATKKEIGRIQTKDDAPVGSVWAPDSKIAFVAAPASGRVLKLDIDAGKVIGAVTLGEPQGQDSQGSQPDGLWWVQ